MSITAKAWSSSPWIIRCGVCRCAIQNVAKRKHMTMPTASLIPWATESGRSRDLASASLLPLNTCRVSAF